MSASLPEPWLRGTMEGVDAAIAPALFALQQAREDLTRHTAGLTPHQAWLSPHALAPVGFHLRHIAGSIDRLTAYLLGKRLTEAQLEFLSAEMHPGASIVELLDGVERSLGHVETVLRSLDPATFAEPRFVGRKMLPTTVIGLAIHIAEHTQRHVGQTISAAKLARAVSGAA